MSGLTIGSLFSGIGGLELGLERGIGEGCRTVWQVEQDEYCRAVLAKHWPDALRFEDVKEVGSHNLSGVDLICGGFPCQDISVAGRNAGIDGEETGLFREYIRILCALRPRYAVMENVSALLARGLGIVLGELAESGFDAEWDCIPASSVGAPHQRDRIFILAYAHCERRSQWRDSVERDAAHTNEYRTRQGATTHSESKRCGPRWAGRSAGGGEGSATSSQRHHDGWRVKRQEESTGAGSADQWSVEPDVGRVANGVPSRVDRLRALGNSVVPQVAEVVGRLIAEREKELRLSA